MAKKQAKAKENIVVFCAHNDDQVLGAGGTLAKYARQGHNIITVIFSYGESSHPWLKKRITIEMRVKESLRADKIMNGKRIFYLGLKEGKFNKEIEDKKIKDKIMRIIKIVKPEKIFTHSRDDPHPDHRAVNSVIKELTKKIQYKGEVYAFDVWNPISIKNRNMPKLVVDISSTFHIKVKAFKEHKSQKLTMLFMMPLIYAKAMLNGLKYGFRYAEVFYKIN